MSRYIMPKFQVQHETPDCHPERKHHGLGLCHSCYSKRKWKMIRATVKKVKIIPKQSNKINWAIKQKHCSLCGIDFNPERKKDQIHPDICSSCESDVRRSAFKSVDLTQEKVIHDRS